MSCNVQEIIAARKKAAQLKRVRRFLNRGGTLGGDYVDDGPRFDGLPGWDDARAKRQQIALAKARAREEIQEERREAIRAKKPGARFIGDGRKK